MPLPSPNAPWPPLSVQPIYDKMAEWAAWYSGEPSRIIDIYAARSSQPSGAIPWYRFYRRAAEGRLGYQRALLHVPVASDLAAVSASLLFGESPRFRIKEAHEKEKPEPAAAPGETSKPATDTPEQRAERRMLEVIDRGGLRGRLLEAAETGAAIGGVYVYPVWDTDLFDIPVVAVAQADMAVPEFKWGFLIAVTFHRVINVVGNDVYRHVERHEVEGTGDSRKAVVLNALYKGTKDTLGPAVELTGSEATLRLQPRVELPFQELDVEYVPNIRPNRLFRANGEGVADIQGSESLLDAIDETYASWMRDIRLAKARIIVPRDYLRNDADGTATFDVDQEIYTTMDMEPSMDADARAMLAHQFAIRYLEHRETTREFIERVVSNAGYSPTSVIGAEGPAARSGAALRVGEHKTILTQRRKAGHWTPALSRLLYHMNLIDREIFKSDALDIRPTVEMSDSIIDQPLELAQTALALKSAEAASIESRVRVVRPEWSDAEVASEVARIKDDTAAAAKIDAESKGMFGDPDAAPEAGGDNFPTTRKTGTPGSKPPTPAPFARKA